MRKLLHWGFGVPIHIKLIAVLTLCGLAPTLGAIFSLGSAREEFSRSANQLMQQQAFQLSDVIDRNLFERYGDVQAFAASKVARDFAADKNASNSALVEMMNINMALYDVYQLMLVTDTKGIIRAVNSRSADGRALASDGLVGKSVAHLPWFKAVLEGRTLTGDKDGAMISGPERSALFGTILGAQSYTMNFAAAIYDETGDITGVWINAFDFGTVEQIVGEYHLRLQQQGYAEAEYIVADRQGLRLVNWQPRAESYRRDFSIIDTADLRAKNVQQADGLIGIAAHDGAYDFPGMGWKTSVILPKSAVYGRMDGLQKKLLFASLFFGGITLAFSLFIGFTIAYPIGN